MTIRVKYFASLREEIGRAEDELSAGSVEDVRDVWDQAVGREMPENTLMAVNMEYVSAEHAVRDGDEVAFFPPVTGG